MPRRAARKDTNHDDIVDAWEKFGYAVAQTYQLGDGFPDLVIAGSNLGDRNCLVEIKYEKGDFTPMERTFWDNWPGMKEVVYTVDDVVRLHLSWGPLLPQRHSSA